jgi:polysaccharide deacetylase family protein (PEP-CTERM system associated)
MDRSSNALDVAVSRAPRAIANAFTVDVEDYFQVSALAPYIARADWDRRECRVERNVEAILALLARHGAHGTFFTLGWIAERYPSMVRSIATAGHEVASHGYGHQRASDLDPRAFLADITRAKAVLEDVTGDAVKGYRAPSFSIGASNPWAFDCIEQAGYEYSSSVYPVRHDHYGLPDAPRFPYWPHTGLLEIPITTARVAGRNVPAGGGGYFRLLPYAASRWLLHRLHRADRRPAIFYCHPWELDPGQPRIPRIDARTRFRHYVNLDRMHAKIGRLLADFAWDRVDRVFLPARP